MTHTSPGDDLLGKALVVIAVLAVTEGRPDFPAPTVVAAVAVVTVACLDYLHRHLVRRAREWC